ncbi:hypothetical protein [Georgenia sp. H159]|uniref:hypothetical protein n=1 Tax=Georgenia sp. H159 TaxID=3076115 RepID=UPI002D79CD59|nr:hypothetical protein [Georgenia sp. H159]
MTAPPRFMHASGLRRILIELHRCPDGWSGPEAQELLGYCAERYRALARKYGQSGEDAATAAYEALTAPATRWARDPWGVVTTAVQRTLQAEHRAHGLLCGAERARHLMHAPVHDVTRFADNLLLEQHPAFQVASIEDEDTTVTSDMTAGFVPTGEALADAVRIFIACGWPADVARGALDLICSRLMEAGQRRRAFEYLRRHPEGWGHLDLSQEQWTRVLTVVLGAPHPDLAATDLGRGLLWRLLVGQRREEISSDQAVTTALATSAPLCLGAGHA